jgi:hypothetical protein
LSAGHNPFLVTASDLSGAGLPEIWRANVGHPDLPSIYPPVAQWWFRILAMAGSVWAAQGLTALADLGIVAWLYPMRRKGLCASTAWALHPIAAVESASGAHIDTLAILVTVLAVGGRARPVMLMLGAGIKLFPALLLPLMPRDIRGLLGALAGMAAVFLLAIPILDAGPQLFSSLSLYRHSWEFNPFGYTLLHPVCGSWTRPILSMVGGTACLVVYLRVQDPWTAWMYIGLSFLALSPTVYPWYVGWALVPALACGNRAAAWASVPLVGSYLVLASLDDPGGWTEAWWLAPLTWVPAAGLAALSSWIDRKNT